MTTRGIAYLLCAFLAVPLCCCGWHGVTTAVAEVEQEVACPLCHAVEPAAAPDDDGCPCMKDLVQRDLGPRALNLEGPGWSLALLAAEQERILKPHHGVAEVPRAARRSSLPTGPPRLYLKHQAWLC